MTTRRAWTGTGDSQFVPPDQFNRIPEYDPRSNEHLWIVTTVHQVNPGKFTSDDADTPMLDTETLIAVVGPGCYHCEQVYTPLLASRRCPGEPRGRGRP